MTITAGNNLQGSIPEEMAEMTEVKVLLLSSNNLTGTLPAALFNLTSLRILDLVSDFPIAAAVAAVMHLVFAGLQNRSTAGFAGQAGLSGSLLPSLRAGSKQ